MMDLNFRYKTKLKHKSSRILRKERQIFNGCLHFTALSLTSFWLEKFVPLLLMDDLKLVTVQKVQECKLRSFGVEWRE